mmetsp:Transcript_6941/g.23054  ORF Transcript_6941/g.23054 Transcript_6941/m.23054 type:complete len:883 (+) Transcript_6941:355-3003(+)|eukprot:CAMPEP_0170136514 /NCGR_PEP_ID=MMETSP0033_2-20121228/3362_1 /TAXON_ID=195969 /ORGANISM="Dolichomastix tenuilepis, Strain CCMP3274" /LENGTH=882 /DNA_ID=CAMNT_0010372251 /DNA_START=359 /DNA_END=3007 /DNA_ORIENTATION=-
MDQGEHRKEVPLHQLSPRSIGAVPLLNPLCSATSSSPIASNRQVIASREEEVDVHRETDHAALSEVSAPQSTASIRPNPPVRTIRPPHTASFKRSSLLNELALEVDEEVPFLHERVRPIKPETVFDLTSSGFASLQALFRDHVLLEVSERTFEEIVHQMVRTICEMWDEDEEFLENTSRTLLEGEDTELGSLRSNGMRVLLARVEGLPVEGLNLALSVLDSPVVLNNYTDESVNIVGLVLAGPTTPADEVLDQGALLASVLRDKHFRAALLSATNREESTAALKTFAARRGSLPEPSPESASRRTSAHLLAKHTNKRSVSASGDAPLRDIGQSTASTSASHTPGRQALHEETSQEDNYQTDDTLKRKGLGADCFAETRGVILRMANDWNSHGRLTWSSIAFISLPMVAVTIFPAIALGVMSRDTLYSPLEVQDMLLGTWVTGTIYSLIGGQPVFIVRPSPGIIIFAAGLFKEICLGSPEKFERMYPWVCLWTALLMFALAMSNGVTRIKQAATPFTIQVWTTYIAMVKVLAVGTYLRSLWEEDDEDALQLEPCEQEEKNAARTLTALLVIVGTVLLTFTFSHMRDMAVFAPRLRSFCDNLALPISVTVMFLFRAQLRQEVGYTPVYNDHMAYPHHQRLWLLPFWLTTAEEVVIAFAPGLLLAIFLTFEHITATNLVLTPTNQVERPETLSHDYAVIAISTVLCGVLGLPPCAASDVDSQAHLHRVAQREELVVKGIVHKTIMRVQETRVTSLLVHLAAGLAWSALPIIGGMALENCYGVIMYTATLHILHSPVITHLVYQHLWTSIKLLPRTHMLRRVDRSSASLYNLLQVTSLFGALYAYTHEKLAFPLITLFLVVVRSKVVGSFITPQALVFIESNTASS